MEKRGKSLWWIGGWIAVLLGASVYLSPYVLRSAYTAPPVVAGKQVATPPEPPPIVHIATPDPMKAIYMTACVASDSNWRESLKKLIDDTELNSVVIDIKDATGRVSFPNNFEQATPLNGCLVPDMKNFIDELHQDHIYVIGRIAVFQDPSYTKLHPELAVKSQDGGVWKDFKGLSFIDVGAQPYWDHVVDIAKASYQTGFDELNFDYVRYPSDGNMSDAVYSWTVGTSTKSQMLESFFTYLDEKLVNLGVVTSADLFGMTTTVSNDMNIGQILEKALPHFDYIYPMVYPSHYPATWNGFANPAEHPYEVIKIAMTGARDKEMAWNLSQGRATSTPTKIRPWLQDFNLGATYDVAKVDDQIRATYENGISGWLLWNAGNVYTREALQ